MSTGVPEVSVIGQGGLLDVVLSPDFATDNMIYLSYAEAGNGGYGTAGRASRPCGSVIGERPPERTGCDIPGTAEKRRRDSFRLQAGVRFRGQVVYNARRTGFDESRPGRIRPRGLGCTDKPQRNNTSG